MIPVGDEVKSAFGWTELQVGLGLISLSQRRLALLPSYNTTPPSTISCNANQPHLPKSERPLAGIADGVDLPAVNTP